MIIFERVDFSYTHRARALTNINLEILEGKNLGIVGESGSGKSTIMKLALGLLRPARGSLTFDGQELRIQDKVLMRNFRRSVQAVFQDPYSSLDPKQKISGIVAEPLVSLGLAQNKPREWVRSEVTAALHSVGLFEDALGRYPYEFSGGQRQRIAIARAIISKPRLLLADEPVSSLDVVNRELILKLLNDLRGKYGLTIAVISHDLSVISSLCEEIVVVERGEIVESGETQRVLGFPQHPYTEKLLRAVPRLPK